MLSRAHIRYHVIHTGHRRIIWLHVDKECLLTLELIKCSVFAEQKLEREAHLETKNERDSKCGTGEVEFS